MNKGTFFTGQPIFSQLLKLIPSHIIRRLEHKYNTNRYCKKFFAFDHLVTMLFCCFHQCTSLREVITGMLAMGERLKHLGLKNTPRRSTLADSNARRHSKFFEELFHSLLGYYLQYSPDSRLRNELKKLFIIDSTTITLFKYFMKAAGSFGLNGKKKGGAKAHVLLDAGHNLPAFVHLSEARMSDKKFLNRLSIPSGSVVVMDKGYNVYSQFMEWTYNGVIWITRLNSAAVYEPVKELKVTGQERLNGVKRDQIIMLGNPRTTYRNPLQKARLIDFTAQLSDGTKDFQFITNDMDCKASDIATYYKRRWQIEVFFKRLKQNFPLQYFLGDNSNAVLIQIWCCFIADLLLKVVLEKVARARKRWSFANLSAMVRLHLGTYVDLIPFLLNPEKALLNYKPPEPALQMQMFTGGLPFR